MTLEHESIPLCIVFSQIAAAQDGLNPARKFVPPGRLLYLRPRKTELPNGKMNRTYEAVWTTGQRLVEEGILMSPRSMFNHIPYNSYDLLVDHVREMKECQQQNLRADV